MTKQRTREASGEIAASAEITVKEAGRRGGIATRDRRGVEFLRQIAKKGGEATKARWGHLFCEYGKRGGRPKRQNLEDSLGGESPENKEADAVGPGDSPPA